MLERIISGGQTGADQAGWRAGKAFGLKCSGWMPNGYRTERPDGTGWGEKHPEFAELYGALEHESDEYPPRNLANAKMASVYGAVVAVFNKGISPSAGTRSLQNSVACLHPYERARLWVMVINIRPGARGFVPITSTESPDWLADWIKRKGHPILMVAGNRESSVPGIGAWVEDYLRETFRLLGLKEVIDGR